MLGLYFIRGIYLALELWQIHEMKAILFETVSAFVKISIPNFLKQSEENYWTPVF